MEDVYGNGFPSTNSTSTEDYPCNYQHPITPPSKEPDFEAFGASWSSALWESAASSDAARVNTCDSIKRSTTGSSFSEEETSNAIKARISSHPLYSKLLEVFVNCQKVGAPAETANLFDELLQENKLSMKNTGSYYLGEDPELDEFMETYCDVLSKCKLDLGKPYDEAIKFLSNMESRLNNLCNNIPRVLGTSFAHLPYFGDQNYNSLSRKDSLKGSQEN